LWGGVVQKVASKYFLERENEKKSNRLLFPFYEEE